MSNPHCYKCGTPLDESEIYMAFTGSVELPPDVDPAEVTAVICEYCSMSPTAPSGSNAEGWRDFDEIDDAREMDYWDRMLENIEKFDPTCWE
jgi:hypothetical protein